MMQAIIVKDSPGWALHLQLSGWLAHEWANASEEQRKLWDANKGTLWRWSIKEGGDLYFKSGKSLMRSSKMVEKERSIMVMIIKNRFWSWNKKKMGWTLPLGKSQRNEKINLAIGKPQVFNRCSQETPSFQTPWSGSIRKHQVFQPFFCHPLRTTPGKSYFSHLSYHIFFPSG